MTVHQAIRLARAAAAAAGRERGELAPLPRKTRIIPTRKVRPHRDSKNGPALTQIGDGAHQNVELPGTTSESAEHHLSCGARECPTGPSILGEVLEKLGVVRRGQEAERHVHASASCPRRTTPNFSKTSPRIEGPVGHSRAPQERWCSADSDVVPGSSTFWCAPSPIWVSAGPFFESLWGRTFLVGIIRVFLGRGASSPRSLPAAAAAARASRMAWCTVIALRGGV